MMFFEARPMRLDRITYKLGTGLLGEGVINGTLSGNLLGLPLVISRPSGRRNSVEPLFSCLTFHGNLELASSIQSRS
jgi:hypothetical protein